MLFTSFTGLFTSFGTCWPREWDVQINIKHSSPPPESRQLWKISSCNKIHQIVRGVKRLAKQRGINEAILCVSQQIDFTSLKVVACCIGGFSEENTRMLDMCVAVLVRIVSQISMKSVTYPQMCDSEQMWRKFVKCREMLMALADLYVLGHSMRNLISLSTFITRKLWLHQVRLCLLTAAFYVQPTSGGKLRTILQTVLVTVGSSVIQYSAVQFHRYLKQDISFPLFSLCFGTVAQSYWYSGIC